MALYKLLNNFVYNKETDFDKSPLLNKQERVKLSANLSNQDKVLLNLLVNMQIELIEFIAGYTVGFNEDQLDVKNQNEFCINDISDSDLSLLENLELSRLPIVLQALVYNILIDKKSKCFDQDKYLFLSAKSYWELFKLNINDADCYRVSLYSIKRIVYINNSKNDRANKFYKLTRLLGKKFLNSDQIYSNDNFTIGLVEIFLENKIINLDIALNILDRLVKNQDISTVEFIFEFKKNCIERISSSKENNKTKKELLKKNDIDLANFYVSLGDKILQNNVYNYVEIIHFYSKAIELYKQHNMNNDVDILTRKISTFNEINVNDFRIINMWFDISSYLKKIKSVLNNNSIEKSLEFITNIAKFFNYEEVKNTVLNNQSRSFKNLENIYLMNRDAEIIKVLHPLKNNEDNQEKELQNNQQKKQKDAQQKEFQNNLDSKIFYEAYLEQNLLGELFIKSFLHEFSTIYKKQNINIDFLVKDNPLIPKDREVIFKEGIVSFLKGDYYLALHLLAPQTENLFRTFANYFEGLTVKIAKGGSCEKKSISSIFSLPELKNNLNNDIWFTFKGLLDSRAGANIRNNIAHGIMSRDDASSGCCLFFVIVLIKLLLIKDIEKIKNTVSINNI